MVWVGSHFENCNLVDDKNGHFTFRHMKTRQSTWWQITRKGFMSKSCLQTSKVVKSDPKNHPRVTFTNFVFEIQVSLAIRGGYVPGKSSTAANTKTSILSLK